MNRQELVIEEASLQKAGHLQKVELLQNSNTDAVQGTGSIGLCHSEMAMHAAKKMRRSRQKLKTGRVVCHHLRMMLAANEPVAPLDSLSLHGFGFERSLSSVSRQQNETQFSLGI